MTTPKKPLVIGNWKMNLDFVEAVHLGQQIGVLLKNRPAEHTEVVVAPPFVDLRSVTSIVALGTHGHDRRRPTREPQ